MNKDYESSKDKTVILNISKINNKKMKIEFGNDKFINFEEKSFGFFKYIDDNLDNIENLVENDNINIVNSIASNNNNVDNSKINYVSKNNSENKLQNPIYQIFDNNIYNSIKISNQSDIEFMEKLIKIIVFL